MQRVSQTYLLRLTSRVEHFAGRALAQGGLMACCCGFLAAGFWTWGPPLIGILLFAVVLLAMMYMFFSVAAAFMVGGYTRFRTRIAQGQAVLAYIGLALAIAGALFFAYLGVAGIVGWMLKGNLVRG